MSDSRSDILVRLGAIAVTNTGETLVALGLGSCVAVLLHDPVGQVGGLAHVLLPSGSLSRDRGRPARAADTAIPALAEQMRQHGASPQRIVARMVGGASMFADLLAAGAVHIGERNVVACRMALRKEGIPIVAEAVGGQGSRSVWFDVGNGTVTVRAVDGGTVTL
ncbi:MAG: chemotaxis protein CheD [Gemmatimonadota bacterium]|nr:MAG: chemotaxis protein CheD [Gemmatimonadota bacterium]